MTDTHRIIDTNPRPVDVGRAFNELVYKGDGATSNFRHAATGSGLERWYWAGASNISALGTGAPTANVLRAIPFAAPARGGYLDRLGFKVTAFVAGNAKIGLYTNVDDSNLYPKTLLFDSGNIAVGANGVKTATLSVKLRPGDLYWLALVSDVAPTITTIPIAGVSPMLGIDNTLGTNPPSAGVAVAFPFAALPATFTAGAAEMTAAPIPGLFMRFSK